MNSLEQLNEVKAKLSLRTFTSLLPHGFGGKFKSQKIDTARRFSASGYDSKPGKHFVAFALINCQHIQGRIQGGLFGCHDKLLCTAGTQHQTDKISNARTIDSYNWNTLVCHWLPQTVRTFLYFPGNAIPDSITSLKQDFHTLDFQVFHSWNSQRWSHAPPSSITGAKYDPPQCRPIQGVCLAIMTGLFILRVLSTKADKISNATGNSISLRTLHSIIAKQQHPSLV